MTSTMLEPSETPSETSSAECSHLDDLIAKTPNDINLPEVQRPDTFLTKEQFHQLYFLGGFHFAHSYTKLESLKIDRENGDASACSGALYDTILDIPAMHFLIRPEGKWAERAMAILMFAVPLAKSVHAELKERNPPDEAEVQENRAKGAPETGLTPEDINLLTA